MENDRYKFRFWDEEDKKYTYYDSPWGMSRPYTETSTFPQYESCPRFHEGILERCTGLPASKSYRGNKPEDLLIFEGDKVLFIYNNKQLEMVVEWDICNPCFVLNARDGIRFEYDFIKGGDAVVEIIGNVHEEASHA